MSASRKDIGSDLAKVDGHQNKAADYDEVPELDAAFFARSSVHHNGVPVRGRPPLGDRSEAPLSAEFGPRN